MFTSTVNETLESYTPEFLTHLNMAPTTEHYEIKNMENGFYNKGYITEEEALKDPPLTDVRKAVDLARSSVNLKGEYEKEQNAKIRNSVRC